MTKLLCTGEKQRAHFVSKPASLNKLCLTGTCDPENVHHIMTSNFSRYLKGPERRKRLDIVGNHSFFNSDFEEWKSQDVLSHRKFYQLTAKTISDILKNQPFPAFDFGSIISTGFNPKTLCIEFPEIPFSNAIDDAWEGIFSLHIMPESLWKLQRWLRIMKERKYSNSIKTVDEFAMKEISIRREIHSKSMKRMDVEEEESFNLLNLYLSEHEIYGAALTDEKIIRDNLIALFFVAEDTNRITLSRFFWLISKNPLVEMKIREELRRNLP
ncbi:alkane hydroxylase MAH1-like [Mangifera indica]|uniref:alkane hydroxylase MAH1-like n=1 Tax=Mangifera indica TaxID=29780 RepID=UPI001CFB4D6D|nr:alkane hydroxylase MAH1-like [Mangifera indica]